VKGLAAAALAAVAVAAFPFRSSGAAPLTPVRVNELHAQWIESKAAHYTVFYEAGFEADVAFTRMGLDATERLMETKYGATPDRYHMSIYLLPVPAGDIDVSRSGDNQCYTRTTAGVRTGTIRLLTEPDLQPRITEERRRLPRKGTCVRVHPDRALRSAGQ
jgi:hypothetical protein